MKPKKLGIVLIVLIALALLLKFVVFNKKSNFDFDVVSFDVEKVDKMTISEGTSGNEVTLKKENNGWTVRSEDGTPYSANGKKIEQVIELLANIEIHRITSRSKKKWEKFGVTDSSGLFVSVFHSNSELLSAVVGTINSSSIQTQQQQNPYNKFGGYNPKSYFRLADDETTYEVKGFLRFEFTPTVSSWRNSTVVEFVSGELKKIEVSGIEHDYFFEKDSVWTGNILSAKQEKINSYINSLANVVSYNFIENFHSDSYNEYAKVILTFLDASEHSIVVYKLKNTDRNYAVGSSFNSGEYFSSSDTEIVSKILKQSDFFVE